MAETTTWGDLSEEEKERVRTEWKAEQEPVIAKQFEDWQEEIMGEVMKRMGAQYGATMSALSQQGGMATFTAGMTEEELPFLKKALAEATPANIIAASQDPMVLETYQNSARFQAAKAKADATTETETTTTTATTETQAKLDDKGEPVLDDKGAPVMEEKPAELSADVAKWSEWTKKNFKNPDTGQPMELPPELIQKAVDGEVEGIMTTEMV